MPPFSFLPRSKKRLPPGQQTNNLTQAFRIVHKDQPRTSTTSSERTDDIFHIDCHTDPVTKKGCILLDDIQQVSGRVEFIRNETRVVAFMKGTDLRMLEPRRIAAVPDVVLDVVIEGEVPPGAVVNSADVSVLEREIPGMSLYEPQVDPTRPRRNPVYGDEMEAWQNYSHIDRPPQVSHLRGPQALLDPADESDGSALKEQPVGTNHPVQKPATTKSPPRGPQAIRLDPIDISDNSTPKTQSESTRKQVQKPVRSTTSSRGPHAIRHIKNDNTSTLAKNQPKGVDKSVQVQEEAENNSPSLVSLPQRTSTRLSERVRTDKSVKDQSAATDKSQQLHPFTSAFLASMRKKAGETGDDQSMITEKPRQLSSNNNPFASLVMGEKIVRAKKKADADLGDVASQVSLGDMYKQGLVVKRDYEEALKWYTMAASHGHSGAQYNLGLLFEHGDGCAKNDAIAFQWFLKSAEQGHPTARYVVADWYEKGRGCLKDGTKSLEWYLKAAEQGHVNAQLRLGWMHTHGDGVPKDESKALAWNLRAADQGDRRGQTLVAEAFENGRGTPKNDYLALKCYINLAEKWGGAARDKVAQFYREGRGRGGDPQDDRQAKKIHDEVSGDTKKEQKLSDALDEKKSDTPAPLDNSSKDGYGFSSSNFYYPPYPRHPQSYGSQPAGPQAIYPYAPPPQPYAPPPQPYAPPPQPYGPPPTCTYRAQPPFSHSLAIPYQAQPPFLAFSGPYPHPYGSPCPFGPTQPLRVPAPPQSSTVILTVPQYPNGAPSPSPFQPTYGFPFGHPFH